MPDLESDALVVPDALLSVYDREDVTSANAVSVLVSSPPFRGLGQDEVSLVHIDE